jgi:cyclic pyranopterin phosphate synthase
MALLDEYNRPLSSLRVSVTDRCNLRCGYCMPEEHYAWLPRRDLLSFEEVARLVEAFCALGVRKLRLTGGEPLLRRELENLISLFAAQGVLEDLALTTNGLLLEESAPRLFDAGLGRVTVSLDSLRRERFARLSKRDELDAVLRGIEVAREVGFCGTKIDTVVLRGVNDDELVDLLEYGKRVESEVRFIEYMDVGGATQWSADAVVSRNQMLALIERHYGAVEALAKTDTAPADRYRLPDGTLFGIIASTTAPFCGACDRSRLTADGTWYSCLYASSGLDLRAPLREGATGAELAATLSESWRRRKDRGAEERLALDDRGALLAADSLARDPRLEMHTRGG